MCGRFSLFADDDELVSLFDIDLLLGEHRPSYNVAPSQSIRVVMDRLVPGAEPEMGSGSGPRSVGGNPEAPAHPTRRERQLRLLEWGLVPGWAKAPMRPMINARAETLTDKPMFRSAAATRRCLVPANGYFEWQVGGAEGGGKQPWFLSGGPGDPVIAFAGVYEAWRAPSVGDEETGEWLLSCAIVTRSAPDALGEIHERTPVVVPADLWDVWLDPEVRNSAAVTEILGAIPDPHLIPRKVGRTVGNVRVNHAGLIDVEP